jgi:hypothetical protein
VDGCEWKGLFLGRFVEYLRAHNALKEFAFFSFEQELATKIFTCFMQVNIDNVAHVARR